MLAAILLSMVFTLLCVLSVGILLYAVYWETEDELPPRHCSHRNPGLYR
jgi:hypothetical protein